MTLEQREQWDTMLLEPFVGQETQGTFTEDEEADSFMAAMTALGG